MQCKLCKFENPSPDVLLKHYRLCHYQGRSWSLFCLYPDSAFTYRIPGALKSNLSHTHRQIPQQAPHLTFNAKPVIIEIFVRQGHF